MAYLFQCRNDEGLFAVSFDRDATNIPPGAAWYAGWRLRRVFDLDEPLPAELDPEAVMHALRSYGYHIWREGSAAGPRSPIEATAADQ
ncbi:MAG: hypothetical protein J2P50_08935 [Hyphomicrobiaceae bacterium]|nr:hypothetical protein [Hyphomicrobiaceae bacterium]